MKDYITPAELAREMDVDYDTILGYIAAGRLPFFKIGRLWRCRRADLDKHINKLLPLPFAQLNKARWRLPDESDFGG